MLHVSEMKLNLKIILVAIVATGIVGYAYYRIADLVRGPRIFISAPSNGVGVVSSTIETKGVIKNASLFTINGHQTDINTVGEFNKTVLLLPGYNMLEFYAEDKFGRSVIKKIEVVRK